ncbi:MAG TPA: ATP/GTP-binding protein [Candidatus Thermoplasmatota archaeon]|nr:ATP/GTP-binding protein [Candidatus Thermoplasmatota archaeon]
MAGNETTVYFVGTAGAGKSTLVAAYDRWAKQHGISTVLVNLDPGAEKLPYTPDVDIREWVKISEIMEEHGLGPNGAQVAAADMIALNLDEVKEEIDGFRADQVLVDTPGQIELFVFRQSGKHIVESLNPGRSLIAYLMDPFLARTATGFTSQLMLGSTTLFRFNEPMVFLLSKADRIDADSLETIRGWAADPTSLESDVLSEEPSMSSEFAAQVTRLLDTLHLDNVLLPVSGLGGEGLDDLYTLLQGAIGQSEEATPEYDTFLGQGKEEPGDLGEDLN